MSFVRAAFTALLLATLSGACGGAAVSGSGAETTAAPAERAPLTELDALQRDFDVSEARLVAQLERREGEPPPVLQQKKAEEAAPADAPVAPKAAAPSRDKDDEAAPPAKVGSVCDLVCRALGSMRRSADGICSLTHEQHERCTAARQRTELSAQRVAAAGCLCRP